VSGVPVEELVAAAGSGDQGAWRELVRRYARSVWTVTHAFRLSAQDAEDVSQTTWLLLAVHLPTLKEPAAVGGWLSTTARRESIRLLSRRGRELPADPLVPVADTADRSAGQVDDSLLRAEARQAVRAGLAQLPSHCRELLAMLVREPAPTYAEISAELGLPRGSIGPTRGRCLERLRKVIQL
jgi:RNA polymerase sigma factor (sigma-70 family)